MAKKKIKVDLSRVPRNTNKGRPIDREKAKATRFDKGRPMKDVKTADDHMKGIVYTRGEMQEIKKRKK